MELTTLLDFLIALAVGALIGIERQRWQKGAEGFAGIRTFILICFLGAISAFLFQELGYYPILVIIFLSIAALIVVAYAHSAKKGYIGITAEISAIIAFLLGFLVMFPEFKNYALIFAVIITLLLSFKDVIHKFIEEAPDFEWNDTLKFALIAFVILPILPAKVDLNLFKDPIFADLNIINLREIWLLVVFVSGVSFVGYFIIKSLGHKKGSALIGAIGGIVSSTAVTQSMAEFSKLKAGQRLSDHVPPSIAVLLATIVSFVRLCLIAIGVNQRLVSLVFPITILILVGLVIYLIVSDNLKDMTRAPLKLTSPFKLKPALILGILFALITMISKLSFALNLGKSGLLVTSIFTGFFEIDPVILAISTLSLEGAITINDSICIILLTIAANQLTKTAIALVNGSKKFGVTVARWMILFTVLILLWVGFVKLI